MRRDKPWFATGEGVLKSQTRGQSAAGDGDCLSPFTCCELHFT